MKAWQLFYPYVLPDVIGCPNPVVDHALVRAARDFFERTRAWTAWQDPVSTSVGTIDYEFELAPGVEIAKVLKATLNGADLSIIAENDLGSTWRTGATGLSGLVTADRRNFSLLPARAAGLQIFTFCALKPSNDATGIDDIQFSQYVEEIANGAKARLLASPKKEYSDINAAMMFQDQFDKSCGSIARKVEKSFSRTPRRVVAHYF